MPKRILLVAAIFLTLANRADAGVFQVKLSSYVLRQGDTLFIEVAGPQEPKGTLAKSKLGFLKTDRAWLAVYGIDAKKTPGNYRLTISSPAGRFDKYITILRRNFPTTKLIITKDLRAKGYSPASIQEDIAGNSGPALAEILNVYNPAAYFSGPFVYPLDKIDVSGDFGNVRKAGQIKLQHLGVDLNADIGAKVYASNEGRVVLAKDLSGDGQTIIVDHGLGIYSLYLHLSEFKVSPGDMVKRGDVIALSGNTGYSLGPHLHFSIKINNGASVASVDPLKFVKLSSNFF